MFFVEILEDVYTFWWSTRAEPSVVRVLPASKLDCFTTKFGVFFLGHPGPSAECLGTLLFHPGRSSPRDSGKGLMGLGGGWVI